MLRPFQDKTPRIHETAFVEESAHVIGDVELGAHSSVWFQCVIRADVNRIRIGHHTNIQDGTVIHVNRTDPAEIGDHVTLGHAVRLHGARGASGSRWGRVLYSECGGSSGFAEQQGAVARPFCWRGTECPPTTTVATRASALSRCGSGSRKRR